MLAAVWGGSYLFNEIALRELGPGMIVWSRVTLGALTVWPLAILTGATGAIRSHLKPLVVTGIVQIASPITLITVGQQWIASSLAGVLNGSVPIFLALFALVLDRSERPTGHARRGHRARLRGRASPSTASTSAPTATRCSAPSA